MAIDNLGFHKFFEEASTDAIAVQEVFGIGLQDDFDESTQLDELQFYVVRVGFSLAHAIGWVDQLHHAVRFMTGGAYGNGNALEWPNRSHYLLYNVENYLVRVVSVYDRCLQLTNAVFHVCMSDEHVNHGLIVSNLHIARTDVPNLLRAVRKAVSGEVQQRHAILHRHSHMDPDLRRLELMYMERPELWPEERRSSFDEFSKMRDQAVEDFTARRKKQFEQVNDSLVSALVPLLDSLLIEYRRQKDRLSKVAAA